MAGSLWVHSELVVCPQKEGSRTSHFEIITVPPGRLDDLRKDTSEMPGSSLLFAYNGGGDAWVLSGCLPNASMSRTKSGEMVAPSCMAQRDSVVFRVQTPRNEGYACEEAWGRTRKK